MGLSSVTLQSPQLSEQQRSNLFWMNVGIGVVLATICLGAAQPVALFYGQAELKGILYLSAVNFLAMGLLVQPLAGLRRKLQLERFLLA